MRTSRNSVTTSTVRRGMSGFSKHSTDSWFPEPSSAGMVMDGTFGMRAVADLPKMFLYSDAWLTMIIDLLTCIIVATCPWTCSGM